MRYECATAYARKSIAKDHFAIPIHSRQEQPPIGVWCAPESCPTRHPTYRHLYSDRVYKSILIDLF